MSWTLGVSSRVLWDLNTVDAIKILRRIGYDLLELWAEPPRAWPRVLSPGDRRRLKAAAGSQGVRISIHATFRDLNIASPNPGVRRESVRQVKESLELASDLEASPVVVHPGRLASSKDDAGEAWNVLVGALAEIADLAGELGVQLCVENMEERPREIVVSAEEVARLISDVGSPCLRAALDVAHAGTAGDPVEFVRRLGPLIGHVHVSDYSGGRTHLPLGEGDLRLREVLSALEESGYAGAIVVEGYVPGESRKVAERSFEILREALAGLERRPIG